MHSIFPLFVTFVCPLRVIYEESCVASCMRCCLDSQLTDSNGHALRRVTFAIMVPTALPFFLDACEQQSASCHGLKQLCLIGEAFGR